MKPRHLLLFTVNLLAFNQGLLINDATKFPILPRRNRTLIPYGIWNVMEKALVDIAGVVLFGYVAHRFGRKKSIMSLGIISFLFQIIYLANLPEGYKVDLACKLINSAPLIISTIYIGETAEDCNRGVFVSSFILSNRLGQLIYSFAEFWFFSNYLDLANILLSLIFVAAASWLPESPIYLLLNNRTEDAKKALSLLKGNSNIDQDELQDLTVSAEKSNSSKRKIMSFITNPATRKALIIGSVTMILSRLLYTQDILFGYFTFQRILTDLCSYGEPVSYKTFLVFSSGLFLEICGVILTVLLVDRCGRKFLLLVSCAGVAFTHAFLVIFTFFELFLTGELENWRGDYFPWLHLTIFVILFVIHDAGCRTVPYVLLSELFQTRARVSGTIFCYLFYCPLTYLLYDTYTLIQVPFYLEIISLALLFVVYFCGFLFIYHCIPETKGKRLQDIAEMLKGQG